jgi:hypothetical protein
MLRSPEPATMVSGLRIGFISGFPWFGPLLNDSTTHTDRLVREFAETVRHVNSEFGNMDGYTSVFRRRVKAVALELREQKWEEAHISALKHAVACPFESDASQAPASRSKGNASARTVRPSDVDALVSALADSKFNELREALLGCISEDGGIRLIVAPIIARMYGVEYSEAHLYRELLEQLPFGKNDPAVLDSIESNLSKLRGEKFSVEQRTQGVASFEMRSFMHTLFLEEYRLCPQDVDRALIETIAEFQVLSVDESAILTDMHLSFLKRSELLPLWQALMISREK